MSGTILSNKDEELDCEPVMEPHEHDVLCGRGGLTNHHPGNAWYRRLVRSNRPLYRESPKHTKLLVAKAIVHHVQNQTPPGRFLERRRGAAYSGMWYCVSYKRAVDKTSQALRERDRENEGVADERILQKMAKPATAASASVMNNNGNRTVPSTEFLNHTYVNNENSNAAAMCAPRPAKVQRTSSWFWQQQQKNIENDPAPLPPQQGLVSRVSSMFRFMKETPLLSHQQSEIFGVAGNNNTMNNNFDMNAPAIHNNNNLNSAALNIQQSGMNGISGAGNTMNNFAMNPPLVNNNNNVKYNFGTASNSDLLEPVPLDSLSKMNRKRSADEAGLQSTCATAPPLTRMATQVSDWLSTFWPVGNEMKQGGGKERSTHQTTTSPSRQQQQQQQTAEQLQAQILQMQEQLRRNHELLQQNGINPDDNTSSSSNNNNNNTFASMQSLSAAAEMKATQQPASGNFGASVQNNSSAASNLDAEAQIRMQMQELYERMQQNANDSSNVSNSLSSLTSNRATAPPSLAANVSSSIFQLASTPSRLLSGLSSFFTNNNNSERRSSHHAVMAAAGIVDVEGEENNNGKNSNLSDWIDDNSNEASRIDNNTMNSSGEEDASAMPTSGLLAATSMSIMPTDGLLAVPSTSMSQTMRECEEDALPSFGRRTSNKSLLEDDDDD
mmetsp:Transcript_4982/g.7195  ORF Transcript_4982/g.7195 Transcript_4982/m.7195 type:complete len:668 (+) Transcript_4982:227-2230(+)